MRFLTLLTFLLLSVPAICSAGQPVEFIDGGVLVVAGAERIDGQAVLTLEGGGQLTVPAQRVVNWNRLTAPRPPAPKPKPVAATAPVRKTKRWRKAAGEYADLIGAAAQRHGLDPALLTCVAEAESAFDPSAVSPKGAQGLLQLMPATADRFGVADPFDPTENVHGGAAYLSWLLDHFEGRTELALAGYNAGEQTVKRYSGVPPYRETRDYVAKILNRVSALSQ